MKTHNEPDTEKAKQIVRLILELSKDKDPVDFVPFLCAGIIANVVGAIPENYWDKAKSDKPCGIEGCNCHLQKTLFMALLEPFREFWKRHMEEKKEQQTGEQTLSE